MPRPLRIEFPGARYHIMNRGNHRKPIFRNDQDRELFLETLDEACSKTGWRLHAYCLMPNHFHLALETPQANLVSAMKWFLGTYTIRFNARHRLCGHLFSGCYKALIINPGDSSYMRLVCQYIHLNPSRAKLLKASEPVQRFPWSSYPAYLGKPSKRPPWLRTDVLFGELGFKKDTEASRRQMAEHMERWRREEAQSAYAPIRRGWFLGTPEERKEFLRHYAPTQKGGGQGEVWREVAEAKAEEWVLQQLARKGWSEERLSQEKKSHPFKLRLAKLLRAETTMTVEWIAKRLKMGTTYYAYAQLNGTLPRNRHQSASGNRLAS